MLKNCISVYKSMPERALGRVGLLPLASSTLRSFGASTIARSPRQHIDRPLLQCASSSCSSTCRKSTCRLFLSVTSTCRQMQLSACLVFPHRHAADAMLPYPLARGGTLARRLNASAFICMAHPSKRRPTCRWMQSQRCRGWAHSEHNARCTGSMGDGS